MKHTKTPGRKVPKALVLEMYKEYKKGKSLREVGRKFKRDAKSVLHLFVSRGLKTRERKIRPDFIVYDGMTFRFIKSRGLYRTSWTKGKRKQTYLHTYIWRKYKGEQGRGFDVVYKDGDPTNNKISNLWLVKHSNKK